MEFFGGNDNYLIIIGFLYFFLLGVEIFYILSLGDEEFEILFIFLDFDFLLVVLDVVGYFDDLVDFFFLQDGSFLVQYGVQILDMFVGMIYGLMEQGGGFLSGGLIMDLDYFIGIQYSVNLFVIIDVLMIDMIFGLMGYSQLIIIDQLELSF